MKNNSLATVLTWVLATSLLFGMFFSAQFYFRTKELGNRSLLLQQEMARKKREAKGDEIAKEEETRNKAHKHWEDVELPKLQDKVDEARESAKTWRYWYDWGMMWGFLFLALAALGYLTPQQPTIRRVVGAIIFCAMMLLIFTRFVSESAARSALESVPFLNK